MHKKRNHKNNNKIQLINLINQNKFKQNHKNKITHNLIKLCQVKSLKLYMI